MVSKGLGVRVMVIDWVIGFGKISRWVIGE